MQLWDAVWRGSMLRENGRMPGSVEDWKVFHRLLKQGEVLVCYNKIYLLQVLSLSS